MKKVRFHWHHVLLWTFVVGMIHYGSTKPSFSFSGGIKSGPTPSWASNDVVSVSWQRDTGGGIYVPESAAVYIDYRPDDAEDEEWGLLAQSTVGAWSWTGTLANATNYDYSVWAYYVPPDPVHTNGVWVYKTTKDRAGANAIPLRARIEADGKAISTPKEKRNDENNR